MQELRKTNTLAARTQAASRNVTRKAAQFNTIIFLPNLNEITQKTAQQESEQASTEWVQDPKEG